MTDDYVPQPHELSVSFDLPLTDDQWEVWRRYVENDRLEDVKGQLLSHLEAPSILDAETFYRAMASAVDAFCMQFGGRRPAGYALRVKANALVNEGKLTSHESDTLDGLMSDWQNAPVVDALSVIVVVSTVGRT